MTTTDIVAVLGAAGCKPSKSGFGWSAICPAHDDHSPSLSITEGNDGRTLLRCHAGCETPEILPALGLKMADLFTTSILVKPSPPPRTKGPRPLPDLSEFGPGTERDIAALSTLRNLSPEGLRLARERGLLRFGLHDGHHCWLVTDGWHNGQVRRMDGGKLRVKSGDQVKAKTLPNAEAAWPVGVDSLGDRPVVLLTEGGPDFLAAHAIILAEGREHDTSAVGILGASLPIPGEALVRLAGRRIRLFPHSDSAGDAAEIRWTAQLQAAGCIVDVFHVESHITTSGEGVGDLNDLLHEDADSWEAHPGDRTLVPR